MQVDFVCERMKNGLPLNEIVSDVSLLQDTQFAHCVLLLIPLHLQIFNASVSVDPRITQGIGGDNMTCMIIDLHESS